LIVKLIPSPVKIVPHQGWRNSVQDDKNRIPSGGVEKLRQMATDKILALKRENAPRISDPSWVSYTGYNYAKWADRGFNIALGLLNDTAPQAGEAGPGFLRRVIALARAQREEYRVDQADEDGACSGALDAAIGAIMDVLPKEPALRDPVPEAEWEVWYRDTFDRECPPSVDVSGRGLAQGLMELWARHLFETVRPGGKQGFSRFHLRSQVTQIVEVKGDWKGATHLREWVFGAKEQSYKGYVKEGDTRLLNKIAVSHAKLILGNQPGEQILAAAAACVDRQDFEALNW
jgi:hypothetical protein